MRHGSALPGIDSTQDAADAGFRIAEVLASGQVYSDFQPIFDLDNGAVVAYEALARGPQGPLRRPDHLFAAARAANRLCELDVLCRRSAIRGAIEAGICAPLTLFVNIEPEIVDVTQLEELLSIADSVPNPGSASRMNLVLEITERAIASRPAELLATVRRLRQAGWRIALDDVGADDISIAFMPLLRPDIVKLDLQLVQLRPSPKIAEIMNAVNAYAERTGSVILAEGIEDEKHLATARALGARLAQGYLFGRPQPGVTPGVTNGELALSAMRSTPAQYLSPFDCLPAAATPRRSTKPLLIEISKHLERQALRLGKTCIVLSTFQEARHFGAPTARRYRALAEQAGFVAAIGSGLAIEPAAGVRGADLDPGDPVRGEWDIVVLAPHFAAALIAREIGPTNLPDLERTFEFVLSYDRATVEAAAQSLMTRISPYNLPSNKVVSA